MFASFNSTTTNANCRRRQRFAIATTESLISDLQQQLEASRQHLAQLQQQQQAEQTAKVAAETALEMVRKARKLVQIAYGQTAVQEFNRTLVASESSGELVSGDDEGEAEAEPYEMTPEDSPVAPSAVTVSAEVVEEQDEEVASSPAENAETLPTAERDVASTFSQAEQIQLPAAKKRGRPKKAKSLGTVAEAIAYGGTSSIAPTQAESSTAA